MADAAVAETSEDPPSKFDLKPTDKVMQAFSIPQQVRIGFATSGSAHCRICL